MTRRHLHVAIACVCGIAFAALLLVVRAGRPQLDLDVATWMAAHRSPPGTTACEIVSYLGSVAGIVPLGLVAAAYLYRRAGWTHVRWLLLAGVGASTLYGIVNLIMESARPPLGLRVMKDVGWSFPSGHATQAVVFWSMASILVATELPRVRVHLTAVAALVIAVTCWSRIYLCEHWATDVLAGLALGTAWLSAVLALRWRPPV